MSTRTKYLIAEVIAPIIVITLGTAVAATAMMISDISQANLDHIMKTITK